MMTAENTATGRPRIRPKRSRARLHRIGVADYRKAEATLHVAAAQAPNYLETERELPEPEWWARARRLFHREGWTVGKIARTLGKAWTTVKAAVDPDFREYHKRRRQNYPHCDPLVARDYKRAAARELARERWRADGKVRALSRYYRDLDCM